MSADSPQPVAKSILSVSDITHASRVIDWLHTYISRPHPQIGRSGAVCPFVPISLKANTLCFVVHGEINGLDPHAIADLLRSYLRWFAATAPESSTECRRRGLVIVLPHLAKDSLQQLDEIHSNVKTEMVLNGLMLGQFYESCPETAVRNPNFRVSTGPVPCFAIRHMAPHDVLFLHSRSDWFAEYHRRFSVDYRNNKIKDPMMLRLFQSAESKWGTRKRRSEHSGEWSSADHCSREV